MNKPPVWITGVGAATPLGFDYRTFADRLLAGQSGVGRVASFPVADHPSQIAAVLGSVPCPAGFPPAPTGPAPGPGALGTALPVELEPAAGSDAPASTPDAGVPTGGVLL